MPCGHSPVCWYGVSVVIPCHPSQVRDQLGGLVPSVERWALPGDQPFFGGRPPLLRDALLSRPSADTLKPGAFSRFPPGRLFGCRSSNDYVWTLAGRSARRQRSPTTVEFVSQFDDHRVGREAKPAAVWRTTLQNTSRFARCWLTSVVWVRHDLRLRRWIPPSLSVG